MTASIAKVEVKEQSVKFQYLAAAVVNLLSVAWGVFEGWTSPSSILLLSDDTPLPSGKISIEEASWLLSLQCVGSLAGNFIFGYIAHHFGRKKPLIIIAFPINSFMLIVKINCFNIIICISQGVWILTWMAPNVYYIYAARLLGGCFIGGGAYGILIPIFLNDIASDHVRGALASTLVLTESFGMVLSFAMGNYCDFYAIPKFSIIMMTIFAIAFPYFPESPLFLLKQNRIKEAEMSLRFYRNIPNVPITEKGPNTLEEEMVKVRTRLANESNNNSNSSNDNDSALKWSDFTTKVARKAILIGIILTAMNQFCGVSAILAYAAYVFADAGSNLSPNMSALVIGIIQVIGNCVATNLVDKAGRKLLLALSNIGTALGLSVLGVYTTLKSSGYDVEAFSWVPVVSLSLVIFIASFGIMILPYIIMPEILPEKIKSTGISLCMSLLWVFSFITIKCLPFFLSSLGFDGSMYMFAAFCVGFAIFSIVSLPETKDKSHEEIMRSLE